MYKKLSKKDQELLRIEHQKGMIDNAIRFFSAEMKDELLKHLDRPGWKRSTWEFLFQRLQEETEELLAALMSFQAYKLQGNKDSGEYFKRKKKVVKECADVSNFSMFIADNFF